MRDLTWTCHICRKERPDRFISAKQIDMKGVPVTMNIRYCNDRVECLEGTKDFSFWEAAQ